jgi:hypothetical protein
MGAKHSTSKVSLCLQWKYLNLPGKAALNLKKKRNSFTMLRQQSLAVITIS